MNTVTDVAKVDTSNKEAHAKSLVAKMANADTSALESFYHLFESTVYRFALTKLNNPIDAADILNEVMLEAWKSAHRFQGNSKVSTWLLSITQFKAIDRIRKNQRHEHAELPEVIEDDSESFGSLLEAASDAEQVKYCMEKLKDEHRSVLHMAFFEDMHYDDIAHVMECPAGTIKSRVYHAKNAMKDCLSRRVM